MNQDFSQHTPLVTSNPTHPVNDVNNVKNVNHANVTDQLSAATNSTFTQSALQTPLQNPVQSLPPFMHNAHQAAQKEIRQKESEQIAALAAQDAIKAPSKLLLAIEGRSLLEFTAGVMSTPVLKKISTLGDNHPVLVLPGLGAGDLSTKLLRGFLDSLGYKTYGWDMGINKGIHGNVMTNVVDKIKSLKIKHGQNVSLVGHSLGGVLAREAAKAVPQLTRQVITLGSPFTGNIDATNAHAIYTLLTGKKITQDDRDFFLKIASKPSVPTTSIFSKMDGIVAWQCSIEKNLDLGENIELLGSSHLGMASSPQAMYIISERLSQPQNMWSPFKPPLRMSCFYKIPKIKS